MVGRRILLVSILITGILVGIGAAECPVVGMDLLTTTAYVLDSQNLMQGIGVNLKISFPSPNAGNVRGEVVLKTDYNSLSPVVISSVDDVIHKAYLRVRFPSFRLTAGKTRLSWGDGMLFNAGDILYGSSSVSVSLTQSELRSETDWMASVNYPLGFFSFAEAVVLPSKTGKAEDMGFGARFYTNVGQTKVEGGYLTKEDTGRVNRLYGSLQGNIGPDWYLASSVTIPQTNPSASDIEKSWLISGGLFHMVYLPEDKNLSLRLELLARPFGKWEFESQGDATCALLLYPEIVYSPTSSLSYSVRAILSPLDLSTLLTAGASWSVFEGFSLIANIAAPFGESGDLFNWDGLSTAALTLGVSWIY